MKRIALITGATSGIGLATAEILADNGFELVLTGRRGARLSKLADDIRTKSGVDVIELCFDIRSWSETKTALDSLEGKWKDVDLLVNNAGLALGYSHVDEGKVEDWDSMIDTNIKGLLYITKLVSIGMVKRKRGHIINIGSIAGKEAYEYGTVYCATKHAVDSMTKGMRIDLVKHNIKVTNVSPGAVETEFSEVRFKGDSERAKGVYKGFKPLVAKDIAETILFAATRPEHVNINDILIMPTAQASATVFNKEI